MISLKSRSKLQVYKSLKFIALSRLVALFLALATCLLSLVKIKNLREDKVDVNPGLYILLWYFLFTAIWIFFIFIEGKFWQKV